MRKFFEFLRKQVMKIINFKKKKLKLLTKGQQESYENTKIGHICKRKIENKYLKCKKIVNLEIIFIVQENIEVLCKAHVI